MKILLQDFSGHPFQAQLSRSLSKRGHRVDHTYSTQYLSGRGRLELDDDDDRNRLSFRGITAKASFHKYRPLRRLWFEWSYGAALIRDVRESRPDLVIACNVPLIALARFARFARRSNTRWVLWHQDVFSLALAEEIRSRFPRPLSSIGAALVNRLERKVVASASGVIAIGDEFLRVYRSWGIPSGHATVIPNWAPVDEITPRDRDNPWSQAHLTESGGIRIVYAGTLGRKHNPDLLLDLLARVRAHGSSASLIVVSEGDAADELQQRARDEHQPATFFGFQPAEDLPDVLGSADVMVALLEPEASRFSIPSKVLSYLAAGRPILGLMPSDNPAAVDIVVAGGFAAEPSEQGVVAAANWLAGMDQEALQHVGRQSRQLAVDRFSIDSITDRFEVALGLAKNSSKMPEDA